MKWYCSSFQIAAAQIILVREPCKTIEEVKFTIYEPDEQEEDYCSIIDKALAGDNFPSLRLVILHKTIPWDYFPILRSRDRLEAMEY